MWDKICKNVGQNMYAIYSENGQPFLPTPWTTWQWNFHPTQKVKILSGFNSRINGDISIPRSSYRVSIIYSTSAGSLYNVNK